MKMWSDVEYVYRCLADTERTGAYRAAIEAAVRPGDTVLDLGSGSGIMGLFALRAGAGQLFAVEAGRYLSQSLRKTFNSSGYGDRITLLRKDARKLALSDIEKPNVVICEMITTGLIGEMQGPVLRSLRAAGIIDEQTRLVPASVSTSVALVDADFSFFDLKLQFPIFVDHFSRRFDQRVERLSEDHFSHTVDFASTFGDRVMTKQAIAVTQAGIVNGLLLTSATGFGGGSALGGTVSYCQPVILPVVPAIHVVVGDKLKVALKYRLGEGFDSLSFAVRR